MELDGEPVVLLDDRTARRAALAIGLRVVGCAGVLVRAKERGVIAEVRPLLDASVRAGLHLSRAVYHAALAEAHELT